ncbi:DUF4190 domain-containing protein [Jatrophihabitans fulvus]
MADGDQKDTGTGSDAEPDFDPYRFGKPDHPIPPEYAPPGYTPDPPAQQANPYPYGAPPYGQYPAPQQYPGGHQYGTPYPPPAAPRTGGTNGKAVAALVLGIMSIVLCWLTLFALIVIVPAVVFGVLGLNESKRIGGAGRTMAVTGLVCAVVGALLAVTFTVLATQAIEKCGGASQRDEPGFSECVQDNIF